MNTPDGPAPPARSAPPRGRVALISLGCAKNLADSEGLVSRLESAGFALAETMDEADLALVNTCGFIDPARRESVETIARVARHKEYGRLRGLIVSGCLVQRDGAALEKSLPEVDRWLPFRDYPEIVDAATSLMGLEPIALAPPRRVLLTPSTAYAYLKISEGCDQRCAFCAIPSFRGRLASRTIEENVEDATRLAELGVSEVCVVSQDTTAYGRDRYGRPRLVDLVRALTKIDGPRWWRLLYLYPSILRDDVIDEIASNERVVEYVDLPLQHMSTPVLRRMRRGITAERQRALLERIRDRVPDVAVRTTLITGFPGETDADHDENLRAVSEGLFDRLGVFCFSRERGTPSFTMDDPVPEAVAEARRAELMEAQQAVHFASNASRVGRTIEVLVEEVDPVRGVAIGRSRWDAPDVDGTVEIADGGARRVGEILPVRVTKSAGYDLVGTLATGGPVAGLAR